MILDTLDNAGRYLSLHPLFAQAFAYLQQLPTQPPTTGRIRLDGERLIVIYSNLPGRAEADARLECHRRYIDIQYVIRGCDTMGWAPLHACRQPLADYNSEKDIQFFADSPWSHIATRQGSFCIFFPEDAHAPLVGDGLIHKAVLKIVA